MSVPLALDGFDVAAAVERMLGDSLLWWQCIGLFVDKFSDWEQTWQASIGDNVREQKCVHALRSAAANVGAADLFKVAGRLEDVLLLRLAGQAEVVEPALRSDLRAVFQQTWRVAASAWRSTAPDLEF